VTHALRGVRVLDLATLFPGPLLAALLGDLGADVVKVEPEEGDPLRRVGVVRDGESVAWQLAGRNKRSVVVPDDVAARLAGVADVVIVNQPDAVLVRAGWDHGAVRARNPRVVYVAVSAFGSVGPYAGRPGNGSIAEAFGGLAHLNGAAGGPPVLPSLALGDTLGAIAGLSQVLAALLARERDTGDGAFIDLALYEPVLSLLATVIAAWDGSAPAPARSGSRLAAAAPRNVYRCGDGAWVALSGPTRAQIARVLRVIGAANDGMTADELDAAVGDWIATRPRRAVLDAFGAARVPVAPVNDLADLAADPHVSARGSLEAALGVRHREAPAIGAHSAEVLADWLPDQS
jgi:crotonobetainyl-CoA:carnitine CoA-transferase CaiB-like acyl-CoA transferase